MFSNKLEMAYQMIEEWNPCNDLEKEQLSMFILEMDE